MNNLHEYSVGVEWVGNRGTGTSGYRAYGREQLIHAAHKPPLEGSADPTFHGNKDRWNPEELLISALAQCHMLSYLHVAVRHEIVVTAYTDTAVGVLRQEGLGGAFERVTLRPRVTVAEASMVAAARTAHAEAAELCFIANSVNFEVHHEPEIWVAGDPA
ncbi:organic hydroperoxide reductase OsmC/OhrA [Leucobacter exalbidus]|uniref:Organic hydroperoxide reductase OsmC/OhrA n=1 Tax=Leucobacter exalbidus TaxID=662960 RepID=A0A940PM49_9MICO|nr:OsmC family protein [Leucobacter exalbidus]MBP1325643.1 organic hydroperoxide reductase OsmC/OhrA [Leucobacter exalbidus]